MHEYCLEFAIIGHNYTSNNSKNSDLVWADSSCTIPYNISSYFIYCCCPLHHECHTVNVPGEQDKGVCHILTQTLHPKWKEKNNNKVMNVEKTTKVHLYVQCFIQA